MPPKRPAAAPPAPKPPAAPTPAAPTPAGDDGPKKPHGMTVEAFEAYERACRKAGVHARIVQTIGDAPASKGTHAVDGILHDEPYTAALDLSVRVPKLSKLQILHLVDCMWSEGFVPFVRLPGVDGWPADEIPHIHAIWSAVPMKAQLQRQVKDALVGLSGLASHGPYRFYRPTEFQKAKVRGLYSRYNPL